MHVLYTAPINNAGRNLPVRYEIFEPIRCEGLKFIVIGGHL